MPRTKLPIDSTTRRQILRAALELFADRGYAATSVADIVAAARVSKPALYYYFTDKAALFEALVDEAQDERYRLMREAVARHADVAGKLEAILAALFAYLQKHRELTRLGIATAFAAPGEMPEGCRNLEKCERHFELIHSAIREAQASGELSREFPSRELALAFQGQMTIRAITHLMQPGVRLDRGTARTIVRMFLHGASAPKSSRNGHSRPAQRLLRSNHEN